MAEDEDVMKTPDEENDEAPSSSQSDMPEEASPSDSDQHTQTEIDALLEQPSISAEEESALLGDIGEEEPEAQVLEEITCKNLDRILKIPLPVIVMVAEKKIKYEEVLRLGPGYVLEFEKHYQDPLEIQVNNQPIGCGEVVTVGENFALRVKEIGSIREIISKMGTPPQLEGL